MQVDLGVECLGNRSIGICAVEPGADLFYVILRIGSLEILQSPSKERTWTYLMMYGKLAVQCPLLDARRQRVVQLTMMGIKGKGTRQSFSIKGLHLLSCQGTFVILPPMSISLKRGEAHKQVSSLFSIHPTHYFRGMVAPSDFDLQKAESSRVRPCCFP